MLSLYLALLDTTEEKSKFEEIYNMYRQDMFRVAMGILKKTEDAEDAVHDAFVKILNNINKIEQVDTPQTHAYVITIVRNTALSMYKKQNKIILIDNDELDSLPNDIPLEDQIIEKADYELLKNALKSLPKQYYEILFLEQSGFTLIEIAKQLDINYQNAKKRLQRAKIKVKELLKEYTHE